MVSLLSDVRILERMRCTESEKMEICKTIDLLCEMTETARQEGYSLLLDHYGNRINSNFFSFAVSLLIETGSSEMLYECCLPYLLTSESSGKEFTENLIILVGLDKLIKGNSGVYLKIILRCYLGILNFK